MSKITTTVDHQCEAISSIGIRCKRRTNFLYNNVALCTVHHNKFIENFEELFELSMWLVGYYDQRIVSIPHFIPFLIEKMYEHKALLEKDNVLIQVGKRWIKIVTRIGHEICLDTIIHNSNLIGIQEKWIESILKEPILYQDNKLEYQKMCDIIMTFKDRGYVPEFYRAMAQPMEAKASIGRKKKAEQQLKNGRVYIEQIMNRESTTTGLLIIYNCLPYEIYQINLGVKWWKKK